MICDVVIDLNDWLLEGVDETLGFCISRYKNLTLGWVSRGYTPLNLTLLLSVSYSVGYVKLTISRRGYKFYLRLTAKYKGV